MTKITSIPPTHFDLITIKREARALRAQVLAQGFRNFSAWVRARLAREPQGRTA